MVNPTVLTSIPDSTFIQSSSGKYYKKSTVNNRPSFTEVGALPSGQTAQTDFNSYGGPGGPITKLSEADLSASGSIIGGKYSDQYGNINLNAYNQDLAGRGVPRIYFTPQGPSNASPKPDQKPGIVPSGMNPQDYQALQGMANQVNPPNAGVSTRNMPTYTAPTSTAPPPRPNLINEYGNVRNQLGLSGAEGELQTAKQNLIDTQNTILAGADKIKGEQVSSVVINRKLVKLDADTAQALRQAQSGVQLAQDMVDNKNKTLSILMGLTEKDYANVRSDWEFEYNKAIQLYTALGTEQNRQRDDARAQLAVLQKNGFDYATATPENKSMVDNLDLQAYGRTGVTASTPPGDKEIDIYTDNAGNRIRVTQNQSTKQYKQTIIGTGLKTGTNDKNTSETANVPQDVIGGIRTLIAHNAPMEEIKTYVEMEKGYSLTNPEVAKELKGYAPPPPPPSTFKWYNPSTWF